MFQESENMSVKLRQELERKIAKAAIKGILASGYTITVNNVEEDTLLHSTKPAEILKAMFTTDEEWLIVGMKDKAPIGWVRFIYGNDGWDVINDYTTNLEETLKGANTLAAKYE